VGAFACTQNSYYSRIRRLQAAASLCKGAALWPGLRSARREFGDWRSLFESSMRLRPGCLQRARRSRKVPQAACPQLVAKPRLQRLVY